MAKLFYTDEQIVRMTPEEVERLSLLCPKRVFFMMETSGSLSAWTSHGEHFAGTNGSDIVRCAVEIREKDADVNSYNRACGRGDNWRNYTAHIRVEF